MPSYLIVIEGTVHVAKLAENGREIVLYRTESGETCVLTPSRAGKSRGLKDP